MIWSVIKAGSHDQIFSKKSGSAVTLPEGKLRLYNKLSVSGKSGTAILAKTKTHILPCRNPVKPEVVFKRNEGRKRK